MTHFSYIVVLTGAGISAESGVDTFRDKGGIWSRVKLEEVATPEGFAADPMKVHEFYNARRRQLASIEPNDGHRALAKLERAIGGEFLLVTQNIDDLHERAGSRSVVHMHGRLDRTLCEVCGDRATHRDDLSLIDVCSACGAEGRLRPDVVWFGEMPHEMERIYDALGRCDLFVSVGTSGSVYPAAQFVQEAGRFGAHTVELNLEPSLGASDFAETRHGRAGTIVPQFVDALLAETNSGADRQRGTGG